MALDDLLLKGLTQPLLRVYCWKHPCVTFGYFQQWHTVRKLFPDQQLVRRSTGGGSVVHGNDLTFSLMFPQRALPPLFFYQTIHQAMAKVLRAISVTTQLASAEEVAQHACCFTAPALYDLLWNGKKILGGTQRRYRDHLLYQGSLSEQVVAEIPNVTRFFSKVALCLSQEVNIIEENPHWLKKAATLAIRQYRSESWTKKR